MVLTSNMLPQTQVIVTRGVDLGCTDSHPSPARWPDAAGIASPDCLINGLDSITHNMRVIID